MHTIDLSGVLKRKYPYLQDEQIFSDMQSTQLFEQGVL